MRKAPATEIARILCDEIFAKYGICESLFSNNGSNMTAKVMLQVCHMLNIKKKFSLVYNPSTNGLVERVMTSLNLALFVAAKNHKKKWDSFLPYIQAGYNAMPHKSLGYVTPFKYLHGYDYPMPSDQLLKHRKKVPNSWKE